MPDTIEPTLGRRLAWFLAIAVASGLGVAVVAEGLRMLLLH